MQQVASSTKTLMVVTMLALAISIVSPLFSVSQAFAASTPVSSAVKATAQATSLSSQPRSISPRFNGTLVQSAEITVSDSNNGEDFGDVSTMSADGSTIAIVDSTNFANNVVDIFVKSGNNWTKQTELANPAITANHGYISTVRLSADGNTALIYGVNPVVGGAGTVAVYIYTRSGGNWSQAQSLDTTDSATGYFNSAAALSGDASTIFLSVSSPITNPSGSPLINLYVYSKSGNSWNQVQKLTANQDCTGNPLSLSNDGSTAFVSYSPTTYPSNPNQDRGIVCVFTKNGSTWSVTQQITAPDSAIGAHFGSTGSSSTDGSVLLIGAPYQAVQGVLGTVGAAYMYVKSGGTWNSAQELTAPDASANDVFAGSVSLSGDGSTAVIGNLGHTVNNNIQQGAAYIFTRSGSTWSYLRILTGSDSGPQSFFGATVSLSSDGLTLFVDAGSHIVNNQVRTGVGYIFTPSTTLCQPGTGANASAPTNSPYTYYLPFLACDSNNFTTYLAFQNTASVPATVTLQYFNSAGTAVATPSASCSNLAPFAECIAPNPFADGAQGTGVLYSTQPLNVIVSEATPYGGSAYAVTAGGSNNLVAPVIIHNGLADFTTNLTIFNGGSSSVTGTVQFYQQDGTQVITATKSFTLTADTSINYDQASDSTLGNSFYGWAQISSASGSQLVAQILEQSPSQHFVALANAQASSQTTLYAPAIFHNAYGTFNTGVNIVNPNSQAITVSLTYYNKDGSTYTAPAFQLAAHSLQGIYQGSNTAGTGLPTALLPDNFAGAAVITATGGVVMAVNEFGGVNANGNAKSGTYSAAASSNNSIGLPVVANGGYGYVTGATIFNTSSQTVTGTIQYYNTDGTTSGTAKSFSVGPHQSFALYQGDSSQGLATNFYGTAIVTENGSGKDLIITTNAASSAFFYTYTENS